MWRVASGVVRQAHQKRWVRWNGWVLLGPLLRQAQGGCLRQAQGSFVGNAGMRGMCSVGWGNVFSFWANVFSFWPEVFSFRPNVFTLAGEVFSFRRYAVVGDGAGKEGKTPSFGKLRTGLWGRRNDGAVSTRSGRCVQFLARCVNFSAECVQFPCECVHFGEGCVSEEAPVLGCRGLAHGGVPGGLLVAEGAGRSRAGCSPGDRAGQRGRSD